MHHFEEDQNNVFSFRVVEDESGPRPAVYYLRSPFGTVYLIQPYKYNYVYTTNKRVILI
jgi:hypothetical protein